MRCRRERLRLLLLLLLSRERGEEEDHDRPVEHTRCVCVSRIERRNKTKKKSSQYDGSWVHKARAREEGGAGAGGSVPGLYHRSCSSQTDPEENHPLTTQERTEGGGKVSTSHEERKRVRGGPLTDILIPDPLFPAAAIRRRYLLRR